MCSTAKDAEPRAEARIVLGKAATELDRLADFVQEFANRTGLNRKQRLALDLALTEWVTNILAYGYAPEAEDVVISVRLEKTGQMLSAEVEDNGGPFNPLDEPLPDISLPIEKKPIGGLGLLMIRRFMDEVDYARPRGRNRLKMCKRLTPEAATDQV